MLSGETMDSIFRFRSGQEGMIFKADEFSTGEEIVYIPDIDLNEIPVDIDLSVPKSLMGSVEGKFRPLNATEQADLALSYCYTGKDFLDLCDGNEKMARDLFAYVDWQHPSSAYPEVAEDYENEEETE